jgi:hypothetical protein
LQLTISRGSRSWSLRQTPDGFRSHVRRQSTAKQAILAHRGIRVDLLNRMVDANGQPIDPISR